MLDEVPGITYYCFLYSNSELSIESIQEKFENHNKSFMENLEFALGEKLIPQENIQYTDGEVIKFRAKSLGKNVLPVVVKIMHN